MFVRKQKSIQSKLALRNKSILVANDKEIGMQFGFTKDFQSPYDTQLF